MKGGTERKRGGGGEREREREREREGERVLVLREIHGVYTFSACMMSAVCFLDIPLSTAPFTDTSSSPGQSDPSS